MFRAQERFLCWWLLLLALKTRLKALLAAILLPLIDQFEYGYRGGVAYASKEEHPTLGFLLVCQSPSLTQQRARLLLHVLRWFDIVFHAAGGGQELALLGQLDANKLAIGVDRDQSISCSERSDTRS